MTEKQKFIEKVGILLRTSAPKNKMTEGQILVVLETISSMYPSIEKMPTEMPDWFEGYVGLKEDLWIKLLQKFGMRRDV